MQTVFIMEIVFAALAIAVIVIYFYRKNSKNKISEVKKQYNIDDQFNSNRRERELEIDSLLEKMGENGIQDLREKDQKRLEELSKK